MRSKLSIIIAAIVLILIVTSPACASQVYVDGKKLDVVTIAEGGTTLVPLRVIFQALGASVDWDRSTQTVTATKEQTTIKLQIGSNTAYKNGQPVALQVPGKVIQGNTMVPLRFVSESMGCVVNWDGATSTITIVSGQAQSPAMSTVFYENKVGNFGLNVPAGWLIEDIKNGDIEGVKLKPEEDTANIVVLVGPSVGFGLDTVFKEYLDTNPFGSWEEVSRQKISTGAGEAWLVTKITAIREESHKAYIMVNVSGDKVYNIMMWWNLTHWPNNEKDFRGMAISLKTLSPTAGKPAPVPTTTPPANISNALSKEFGSVGDLSRYKITDTSLGDTIFVSFEMDDYDANRKWRELPEPTRREFLKSVLNRLHGWYPGKDIAVYVKIVYDYHTWNPRLDDNIISFNVNKGWYVSNTYYSGSANYFKLTNTVLIDPNE